MLAEIAAANAAFGVLKTALSNGRDLYECGNVAKKYFDNKAGNLIGQVELDDKAIEMTASEFRKIKNELRQVKDTKGIVKRSCDMLEYILDESHSQETLVCAPRYLNDTMATHAICIHDNH